MEACKSVHFAGFTIVFCSDTVPSKSSWNKIKYFLTISKNVFILNAGYQTIWIGDQAQRNVGPDLRSILFDTQHQFLLKTGCIAWDYLNYVAI